MSPGATRTSVSPGRSRRLGGSVSLAAAVLLGWAPAVAAAPQPAAPCATCVALLIGAEDAAELLATAAPVAGLDVVFHRQPVPDPAPARALAEAGAHVWRTLDATDASPPPDSLAAVTGVFLAVSADADARGAAFAIRRAATDLRGLRPELRVGLVLTPELRAGPVPGDVAPYLDALWLPGVLAPDAASIERQHAGLASWIERGPVGVLSAAAGPGFATAVVDAAGRAPALARALAALRPLMPPGLTPLPEVQVVCDGCRADVWMHPETREAIAVLHGAAGSTGVTIAPDAVRVAHADVRSGRIAPLAVTREGGVARVRLDGSDDPLVLRIEGWRGVDEEVYRADVRVSAARTLAVEEIVARHQARQARQARLVQNAISAGTTVLTFEVPGLAGPMEVSAATTIFRRGALTEIAQHDVRVNGVDMRVGAAAPRLPLIEPERVSSPPLAITLSSAYEYRLAGRDREAGRECYVVAFTPRDASGPSFSGRAWIDVASFALVRIDATQTGLAGAIVSNEQRDVFAPVMVGDSEVWLPSRSSSFQIYQAAAVRTPIQRLVVTPRHEINVPDFADRLSSAHRSDAVMLRDTPDGYRYLVPAAREARGPAGDAGRDPVPAAETARVVAPGAGRRVVTLVFGTVVDPNITVPLPFAGLSFLDFDFLQRGGQFSGFFGGTFGQAAWTVPAFLHPRWQLTGRVFGIAVSYNDRSFRDGIEQYGENILQRPFRADATVVAPISARAQLRVGYEIEYTAFDEGPDTAGTFVVPTDALVHGLRVALDVQRGPWSVLAWWNPARRQGWRPWGRAELDYAPGTEDFQRYGVTAGRSWVLAPGALVRLEGSWLDGHDLDRFSRYTFDSFENRLRGYPSASLRFDRGGLVRSAATWTPVRALRVDGFFDYAAVHDPGFGPGLKSYPGIGAALEVPLPARMLLTVEYGYGVEARDTDGSAGTHVVKVTGFKIF